MAPVLAQDRLVATPKRISSAPGEATFLELVLTRGAVTVPTVTSEYRIVILPNDGASVRVGKQVLASGKTISCWSFRGARVGDYRVRVTHLRTLVTAEIMARVQERIPIKRLRLFRVNGFKLTPIVRPLSLKRGQRLELAAEALDDRGRALAFRPSWEAVPPYAGRLMVNPYNGVCTFIAGSYPTVTRDGYAIQVHDPRVPQVRGEVRVRILGPVEKAKVPLPGRLEAYLVTDTSRSRIRKGVGLFTRPGQVSRFEVFGVFGQKRRAVSVTWVLDGAAGTVVRTGPSTARLVSGYTESRPRHPYRLRVYHHRDHRISLEIPLVIER